MKKLTGAIVLALVSLGVVAPAMAWDEKNCPFRDKSMCVVQSIQGE